MVVEPDFPKPIQPYRFNWKVVVISGKPVVGLDYDESLNFRLFLEDINRYIKESNNIICFYRKQIDNHCLK